jgi:hypothetical protein
MASGDCDEGGGVRFLCWLGRHRWERADTFPGWDIDVGKINEEQMECNGRWFVERCSRCGRVESEHLEVKGDAS